MKFIACIKKTNKLIKDLLRKDHTGDDLFNAKREKLINLCNAYSNDPLNMDFINRGSKLIDDFDDISTERSSGKTYSRAKVNAVVTTSRVRKTHLASYLAGKYSVDPKIGNKFKCWIYNAAAISSIQLRESIIIALSDLKDENKEMLSAFADTAILDAQMYLNYSEDHDKL